MLAKTFSFSQNINICEINMSVYAKELSERPEGKWENWPKTPAINLKQNKLICENFAPEEIEKLNSFKNLKKQIEWSAGRLCVKNLAKDMLHRPGKEITVSYHEEGAPFLTANPEFAISISHSGQYAMALIHRGSGKAALDVQTLKVKDMAPISKFILSSKEKEENIHIPEKIIQIFTIKEAFLKYTGQGFRRVVKNIEIFDNTIYQNSEAQSDISFFSYLLHESHIVTIIFEKGEEINEEEISTLKKMTLF